MLLSRAAHIGTLICGITLFLLSLYLAFLSQESFFYTPFVLGFWLTLDYADYKLNRNSILTFFIKPRYSNFFYFFFFVAFIFFFIIDFLWGVHLLKMWEWINYGWLQVLKMFFIMNVSFMMSMYELYRVLKTIFKRWIKAQNLLYFRLPYHSRDLIYISLLLIGITLIISPYYLWVFKLDIPDWVMVLPYLSLLLIPDSVTYLTGGEPVIEELIRLNKLNVTSLLATVLVAFVVTEGINLSGDEWKYLSMPFPTLKVFNIPLAALVGWVPLTAGSVALINMVKHIAIVNRS